MSLTNWIQRRFSQSASLHDLRRAYKATRRRNTTLGHRPCWFERLESRVLLTSDFGDAPLPYPTTLAEHGAMHTAIGPMLGANRDGEPDGTHSATANSDDITGTPNDEDGVTFQTIRAGELGAKVTVVVSNAPNGAKLDAWIDFNGDSNWGGLQEHIADGVTVVNGANTISFNVPTDARDGQSFARFRVSTTGNLGPIGAATDGEVEDYLISIRPPIESSGKFGLPKPIAETGVIQALADLDRDGDLDIVETESVSTTTGLFDGIYWLENDGDANFSRHFILLDSYHTHLRVADLDSDGDVDLIGQTVIANHLQWYENDGRQNFTVHSSLTDLDGVQDIYVAEVADLSDVDGDGDLDVLTVSFEDNKIAWIENDGHQSFLERVITTQATGAVSVTACDFDRDGDMDVVWKSQSSGLNWSENDGNQTFTHHTISKTSQTFSVQIVPIDLDHDGDLDVLETVEYDQLLVWYENDGQQHFTAQPSLAWRVEAFSVADADGDGDYDVIYASNYDGGISWLINDGSSHFTDLGSLDSRAYTYAVLPGDLNQDGRLDLVIGTQPYQSAFTIGWYVNRSDVLPPSLKSSPLTLIDPSEDLSMTVGAVPAVRMRVKNPTDQAATLFGWIDANRDGDFDDVTERTSIAIPAGTDNGLFRLTFPQIPLGTAPGPANVRFVLMPDGSTSEGTEVIVSATVTQRTQMTANSAKSVKLASGLGLRDYNVFGTSVIALGDLDGNGVTDLAIGGAGNEDGYGEVRIEFLNQDGSVKKSGGIGSVGGLSQESFFGASMTSLGDMNGDGIPELAIGANGSDSKSGAVYVVTLRSDGYVSKSVRIAANTNGGPSLSAEDSFGVSVAGLGDLDGDGVTDLAVGAEGDDTGGPDQGAVYVLFLNSDGTVKSRTKIASGLNGGPVMTHADHFGVSMASLGDLDGDGVTDLAVGAYQDQTGGKDRGAAYVLFLNSNGTVKRSVKLASGMNGTPALANGDQFGGSMASLGDLDGNGVNDLAVGTMKVNSSGLGSGAVNLLLLNSDGTVKSSSRLASNTNGVPALPGRDFFAGSIASLGDVDGDGAIDLAVGAFTDSTDGLFHGAVHLLFLKPVTNKAPVFTKGPNQTVLEDTTAQSVKWATAISAGVGDVGQQVHFDITTNSNPTLFSVLPTISPTGVLTYTPAPNANGTATIAVTLKDDGGTSGGGKNSSTATLTITIKPVNDAPVRTAGTLPTIDIDEDSTNATAVPLGLGGLDYAPGPASATDESSQALSCKIIAIPKTIKVFKADGTTEVKLNSVVTPTELQKLKYKTVEGLFGTDLLKFTVMDKGTGAAPNVNLITESVSITVRPVDFDLIIPAVDQDNTVTVSRVGNNLVARRGLIDVITPVPLEDVASLTITGGFSKDTVILDASLNTAGNPAFHKLFGQIIIEGNGGDDKLDASAIKVATFGISFYGGTGNDTALGGAGHETLSGGDDNDLLNGGAGNDMLDGGDGDDQLLGGLGNDTYWFDDTDSQETDVLTEAAGGGIDLLDFSSLTSDVTVKLISEATLAMHANRTIKTSATGNAKVAPNFENVAGGAGSDQILGNAANNSLLGGAGRDTLIGGLGNDALRGEQGDDTLIGGLGADSVFGDSGNDIGLGGRGNTVRGGTGTKDKGDILSATVESINEAFAVTFAFEL